jgi:hypothetical protein
MKNCPSCQGSGKKSIELIEIGTETKSSVSSISCIDCDGDGTVTEEKFQQIQEGNEYYEKAMCTCDNPHDDTYYVPDNDGSNGEWFLKHHWVHKKCGKVVQIG